MQRKGIGKIRHLDVADLWLQKVIKEKRLSIEKIDGTSNDADLLTKPLTAHGISAVVERLGSVYL